MEVEMIIQNEVIRSEIYKLLAESYYPPDVALSSKIQELDKKLEMRCPQAWQNFAYGEKEILSADNIEKLTVDHARLFVGPYTLLAPPYGSVYLDTERRIMGNSTMDVAHRYHEGGLIVTEEFKDPPDHIAAELEFMHYLIFKEIEATNRGDINEITISLNNQQSFLDKHLGAWISDFTENVAKNAQTSFYKNLAMATEAFIKDDYQMVSTMLSILRPAVEMPGDLESPQASC